MSDSGGAGSSLFKARPWVNGTSVSNHCNVMRLRFREFPSPLLAWVLHEGVAMTTTLENARFDPSGTVGHLIGGDVRQHRGMHRVRVGT